MGKDCNQGEYSVTDIKWHSGDIICLKIEIIIKIMIVLTLVIDIECNLYWMIEMIHFLTSSDKCAIVWFNVSYLNMFHWYSISYLLINFFYSIKVPL